jgi:hypothetical protein
MATQQQLPFRRVLSRCAILFVMVIVLPFIPNAATVTFGTGIPGAFPITIPALVLAGLVWPVTAFGITHHIVAYHVLLPMLVQDATLRARYERAASQGISFIKEVRVEGRSILHTIVSEVALARQLLTNVQLWYGVVLWVCRFIALAIVVWCAYQALRFHTLYYGTFCIALCCLAVSLAMRRNRKKIAKLSAGPDDKELSASREQFDTYDEMREEELRKMLDRR